MCDGITNKCAGKYITIGAPICKNEEITSGVYDRMHNHGSDTPITGMSTKCTMQTAIYA